MLRLTERGRRVLLLAKGYAEAVGVDYVGTGHVLVGLLREPEGVAARALGNVGFEAQEVTEQLSRLRGAREPRAAERSGVSRPAKMAVECALQEARVLGQSHADTEHLLLGLMRAAPTYPGSAVTRIVGFEDQLRIRNETLRLVARAPSPAELARRRTMAAAGPRSGFEAVALGLIRDALKKIPAAEATTIKSLTMELAFEDEDREQPQIQVQWNTTDDHGRERRLGAYIVRIPRSGPGRHHDAELLRKWLAEVSRSLDQCDGDPSTDRGVETEKALSLLLGRLARLLHISDLLWEVLGHGIPIVLRPPSSHPTICYYQGNSGTNGR